LSISVSLIEMAQLYGSSHLNLSDKYSFSNFAPPPRFGETNFAGYIPQDPSQTIARDRVNAFVIEAAQNKPQKRSGFFGRKKETPQGQGLYLDGGFGVGKTHLLASAYNSFDNPAKAYMSFQELVYTIGALGKEAAQEELGQYNLICIDEFELDDPGNTLIVKTFLAHAFSLGNYVITTSNTPPAAQGQGRFNADDFKREIQSIAERFEMLHIDGPDYRKRQSLSTLVDNTTLTKLAEKDKRDKRYVMSHPELKHVLEQMHPIRYSNILNQIDVLYLQDLEAIPDQNSALRFVHFIDKLYDMKIGFCASGEISLEDIFDASYRNNAYAKKHYRCLSRLSELIEEAKT